MWLHQNGDYKGTIKTSLHQTLTVAAGGEWSLIPWCCIEKVEFLNYSPWRNTELSKNGLLGIIRRLRKEVASFKTRRETAKSFKSRLIYLPQNPIAKPKTLYIYRCFISVVKYCRAYFIPIVHLVPRNHYGSISHCLTGSLWFWKYFFWRMVSAFIPCSTIISAKAGNVAWLSTNIISDVSSWSRVNM